MKTTKQFLTTKKILECPKKPKKYSNPLNRAKEPKKQQQQSKHEQQTQQSKPKHGSNNQKQEP